MKLKVIERQTSVDEKNRVIVTTITDNLGNDFKGKARCSKEDAFDVEFGSRLSFFRAKSKMYTKYAREYSKTLKRIDSQVEIIKATKSGFDEAAQKVLDNIKGLIG